MKFRSVRSIVIAPASTGKDRRSKTAVINTDQGNIGIWSNIKPVTRRFITVVIKLTAPRMDEIPARWRLRMAVSTLLPEWEIFLERGG